MFRAATKRNGAGSRPIAQLPRVLIVEDNPADVDLICEALNKRPIDVSIAGTGEEALDQLFRRKGYASTPFPSIVVLDLNLPGLNGWEVMSEMRRRDDLRLIPIIVLSSSRAADDIKRSYAHGANCYLSKPGDLDSFRATVTSIENFWLDLAELPEADPPLLPLA